MIEKLHKLCLCTEQLAFYQELLHKQEHTRSASSVVDKMPNLKLAPTALTFTLALVVTSFEKVRGAEHPFGSVAPPLEPNGYGILSTKAKTIEYKGKYKSNHIPFFRETTDDTPAVFNFLTKEYVPLAGCNDTSVYLQCFKVEVNTDVILDDTVNQMALPDGTILTRSEICDDGHVDENGNGCAHFNNNDHTASMYMSYSMDAYTTTR